MLKNWVFELYGTGDFIEDGLYLSVITARIRARNLAKVNRATVKFYRKSRPKQYWTASEFD